jgi:hypothetical protein
MEAVCSTETLVSSYKATQCYYPEDHISKDCMFIYGMLVDNVNDGLKPKQVCLFSEGRRRKYCLLWFVPRLGLSLNDDCFRSLLRLYSDFSLCLNGIASSAEIIIVGEFSLVFVNVFGPKGEEETGGGNHIRSFIICTPHQYY